MQKTKDPYTFESREDRLSYYKTNGYIVYRNLMPTNLCDKAKTSFENEVKPYQGYIYRQASANPEKHKYDQSGHVLNSILNPVSANGKLFPRFRTASQEALASEPLFKAAQELINAEPMIVQSMYFEGNPATWAHQDTYYLDAEVIGTMAAAWIALEDIDERAGLFYIGVGSHRIDLSKNGGDFDIAFNHQRYKDLVLEIIKKQKIELRSPILRKGDVLFWNSKTIHGAYPSTDDKYSRNSLTAHFIPSNMKFLQFQSIKKELNPSIINSRKVYIPKDQNVFRNRLVMNLEVRFPRIIQSMKKTAVKAVTSKKN